MSADSPWTEATATVTSCEPIEHKAAIVSRGDANLRMSRMPEYAVTYAYQAEGRTLTGEYRAHADVELGHAFTICYDPDHPEDNTGEGPTLEARPDLRRLLVWGFAVLFLIALVLFRHR